jgi:hypothetical protein
MILRQALILVASPQAHKSVSHSLATFLSLELSKRSVAAPLAYVSFPKQSAPSIAHLHSLMDSSDALLFIFPLTLDQPPASLVKVIEDYAAHRKTLASPRPQGVMAISHAQVPEARQNDPALAIVQRFAELEDLTWLGGLALGGAAALPAGKPLSPASIAGRHAVKALEKAATSLSRGGAVPQKAIRLMRRPSIPHRLYTWGLNWLMKRHAQKAGTLPKLHAKPYEGAGPEPTEG